MTEDSNNFRGISLLSILSKVFTRVLQQRFEKCGAEIKSEEQTAFQICRAE
jgi:hypothetical protein